VYLTAIYRQIDTAEDVLLTGADVKVSNL